ncbi:MFS transporter [Putridiphycobacter roseus]|uniref:MFS transporter n=1 Tax=Putridiphycobacter roseus TaxID=2219161 RepID=A0A2W1N3Z1_9FLAO|nr:MFS transporter [Putridiphycobacter roseus]
MLVFMTSFNLLIPELNDYLKNLGGNDYKWMILGLWTIAAGIARPFSGKIADNFGRKPTLYIGISISIIVSFFYPLFTSVFGFLVLRFLHGFSTGFQPTGATALVGDIIPYRKRGEAMGIFSLTISIGFGLGNFLSSHTFALVGINGLFYTTLIMGLIALATVPFITESMTEKKPFILKNIIPRFNEIIAPEVIHPAVIMFLTAMCGGIYYLMVPDFSTHLGLTNKGLFFGFTTMTTIFIRFFAGRATDKYGRVKSLYFGVAILFIAMTLSFLSTEPTLFMISGAVYGIGSGITSPALFAWTTDLANPRYKGRGMGTLFIALEFGIFAGTYTGQLAYQNNASRFGDAFLVGMILCIIGLFYLSFRSKFARKLSL